MGPRLGARDSTSTAAGAGLGDAVAAGLGVRPGEVFGLEVDLRHAYASALIQAGESVKVVQARMGHASAMVTLDVCGHLWPDSDDRTRAAVDAFLAPLADSVRTETAASQMRGTTSKRRDRRDSEDDPTLARWEDEGGAVTRVVAGAARGRRLAVPVGRHTRPTADRAREGLFSTLESLLGSFAGRRVADLYAGSGAVGLESLSRGAAHCLLVENDPTALRTLRANVAAVDLPGAEVVSTKVERVVAADPGGDSAYDMVFLDPPYDLGTAVLLGVVNALVGNGWLAPEAVVVVERATRDGEWRWPAGVVSDRSRRYGEATLWYGRAGPEPEDRPSPTTRPIAGE